MKHSIKWRVKTNRNGLAFVSHSRDIMWASYTQCGQHHQGGISKEQEAILSSRGTGGLGTPLAKSRPSLGILSSYHIPCFMICTPASWVIIVSHCPFFIDFLNSHVHWESHKVGLRHRERTLMHVLFAYLLFLSVAFSPGSGYLFHLAGQLRIRWRMEINWQIAFSC